MPRGASAAVRSNVITSTLLRLCWLERSQRSVPIAQFFKGFVTAARPEGISFLPKGMFPQAATLAKNFAANNAFLTAGLIWPLLLSEADFQRSAATFSRSTVTLAGGVGDLDAGRRTIHTRTAPVVRTSILARVSQPQPTAVTAQH